ncbi:hypothetical protein EDC18_103258 [Natranaerovirga pectinivora]|uniref:Sporulation membrane protein YtrI C-terminal domain-containing protein n=1 Tax=Natranaerovirga pectinivora TaxID=682400 RepID=A0A4R3MLI0_9FIRM|nr:hypothetical protein [Natranaerovirga pectinivora]TCT15552.1 hypothetical protein EDC18_103258 [Natranaerovirga pectinivora]
MVQLISKKFKYFTFFIAGLALGVIIGVSGLTAIISSRIDSFYHKIIILENDIEDKNTRLQRLEESLSEEREKQKLPLKEIQVHLNTDEDEIDKLTLTKHIKDKYTTFIGREIDTIDLDIISQIIDKRIFRLDDKSYQLEVEKIFMSDVLILWIFVEPLNEND